MTSNLVAEDFARSAEALTILQSTPNLLLSLSQSTCAEPVCLQILFVDRSDTVRARVAAGLLERIAEWNGYGRALYPCACGVEAAQACSPLPSLAWNNTTL